LQQTLAIIFVSALYGSVGTKGKDASANLQRAAAIQPAPCVSLTYATIRRRIALQRDWNRFRRAGQPETSCLNE